MEKVISAQNSFKFAVPTKKSAALRKTALAAAGLFIGIVNGLFGAGGGMLVVPALNFIAGLDERKAHATAIAVILPLCLISSIVYATGGGYDYPIFAPTILGVVAGGVLGAFLLKILSGSALSFIFYGLMLFAGIKMVAG